LVRFSNFFEAKYATRFRLVPASSHVISDGLEWDIREWKAVGAEHKTPEKAKVDPARHLEQGVEVGHRSKAAKEARQACTTTSPKHGRGVQDGAVADEIKNGVDPLPFSNATSQIGSFELDTSCPQRLQLFEVVSLTACGKNLCAGIDRH